jgi:thiol-disulfide isomerase/thioredoxin
MNDSRLHRARNCALPVLLAGILLAPGSYGYVSAKDATTPTVALADSATTSTDAPPAETGMTPAKWLQGAPNLAKVLAAARGRSEEADVAQGMAELEVLSKNDPIAALALALNRLFPAIDSPTAGPGATMATALAASRIAAGAMKAAATIVAETKDPLALAIYGHALAIGLGAPEDRVAGIDLIRQADKAGEPYAAMALVLTEADGVPDALERAAASGDLRARYDLVRKQLQKGPAAREKALAEAIALAPRLSIWQHRTLAQAARYEAKDLDAAVALYTSLNKRGQDVRSDLIELGADDVSTSAIGDLAPELPPMDWIQGNQFTLESVRGQKVVVLEFWATWCGPCVASIPKIEELHRQYGDRVAILAISDEDPAIVSNFVRDRKDSMTYPVLTQTEGSYKQTLFGGFAQSGIPTAFVIGKDGRISWVGHPMAGLPMAIEEALARDETPASPNTALSHAVARHLRLASKPGRAAAAREALEALRGQTTDAAANALIPVVDAHINGTVAEPDPEFILGIVDSVLGPNPDKWFLLIMRRGDLLKALGRYQEAIDAYTDSLRVLAKTHWQIEEIRGRIKAAEKAQAEAAANRATPAPQTSPAPGVRPDSSIARPRLTAPRGTPLQVAPRGTPLQLAPRGTPLQVVPRGTPLRVAPRGTPLLTNRKPSDRATTISVEERN